MMNRMIVFVSLLLLGAGMLRGADSVEWPKVTAQSTNLRYQPYLAVDGQFDPSALMALLLGDRLRL